MADKQLWPLRSLRVVGLFHAHSIELPLDPEASIITGENGSGKSTILGAVHLLCSGRWPELCELPLDGVELRLADGSLLAMAQTDDGFVVTGDAEDEIWQVNLSEVEQVNPRRQHELLSLQREIDRRLRTGQAIGPLRQRLGELKTYRDFLEPPPWLAERVEGLETKLISARRLEHRLRPDQPDEAGNLPESVVERYAIEMRHRMRDELSRYAAESRQQERSLPSKIVEAIQRGAKGDPETIAVEVDGLRKEVRGLADGLASVGLLNEGEGGETQFQEYPRDDASTLLAIREVYRVARDRLQRLSPLRSELDLFATFLNTRFADKHVELNQDTGIDVVLDGGERIRPGQLSSGEQQLLALAYELLFETGQGCVVLLDEPELSLHVAWLKNLLAAFLDIGKTRGLQFVIATHAPSILAGHGEREISLDLVSKL